MICFLDMDGVLVDFRRGICEAFGRDDPSTNWEFWDKWGISFDEVDEICTTEFWFSLPWTEEGKQILWLVEDTFDEIYLLTTPMPNPGSFTGKELWVRKHIPKYKNKMILTRASKGLFAGPDRVLIDDKGKNVRDFVTAGGHGILVPRLWNELYKWSNMTLKVVSDILEGLR